MYGRTYADGEAALEALLRQVDAEVAGAVGGGASHEAVPEALAFALDGEAMDAIEAAKQVVETAGQVKDAWGDLPKDIQDAVKSLARQGWSVRGALLNRLIVTALSLIGVNRSLPPIKALETAAIQLNIKPKTSVPAQKGLSKQQVRASDQRQQQRGRKPGQNPQMRSRSQRESEAEAEAVARLLEPWPEYLRDDDWSPDEADYMSRQRGQGNAVQKCKDMLTDGQFNNLNSLAEQLANSIGHDKNKSRSKRTRHQEGVAARKARILQRACRLVVNGSGYQAAVDDLTNELRKKK